MTTPITSIKDRSLVPYGLRTQIFTGDTRDHALLEDVLKPNGWGRCWTAYYKPAMDGKRSRSMPIVKQWYPNEPWILDNGCFSAWRNGHEWNSERYLYYVERSLEVPDCYAVVVPDKVAAGSESAAMSYEWLDILWDKFGDVPFYFVLQDGMDAADMRQALYDPRIHGLFLGGTLEYKIEEGRALRELAHCHNKMFHYGGASTAQKINHALAIHSDSLDSAFWLIKKNARDVAIGLRPQSAASIEELASDADKKRVAEVRWILDHPDLTRQHATSVYAGTTTAPYDVWRNRPAARWTIDADKARHDLQLIDKGLLDWSADNPTEVVVGRSVTV